MRGCKIWKGGWQKMAIFARGGQDALYPALSGEWEVPFTRNAKITPVKAGRGLPNSFGLLADSK
jgi:hypothetical protein